MTFDWKNIAIVAYTIYRNKMIEIGVTLPTWGELSESEINIWIEIVTSACDVYSRAIIV